DQFELSQEPVEPHVATLDRSDVVGNEFGDKEETPCRRILACGLRRAIAAESAIGFRRRPEDLADRRCLRRRRARAGKCRQKRGKRPCTAMMFTEAVRFDAHGAMQPCGVAIVKPDCTTHSAHRKLCGSISTWTRTLPFGRGPRSSMALRN